MSNSTVTLQGNPLHLKGEPVGDGDRFPAFRVVEGVPETIEFDPDSHDSVRIITSAGSVDTAVCANQFQAFDQRAADLKGEGVEVWYITRDLPFALERFADEHDLENVQYLSDYKFREFGEATHLAVEETELLARATYVIDRDGRVVYSEVLDEITEEPDYDAAIEAAREAAK